MDFIFIDFETATAKRSSPCALGICIVRDNKIVERKEWLIQPPNNEYNVINSRIHGITADKTINSPTFPEIWDEINNILKGNYIIAHNGISFDFSVLTKTLEHYNLPFSVSDYYFVDTLSIFSHRIPNLKTKKLKEICEKYEVSYCSKESHNALYDATVLAEVCLKAEIDLSLYSTIIFPSSNAPKSRSKKNFDSLRERKIDSSLKEMIEVEDTSHFFYQKKVVITGTFDRFPVRNEMAKLLQSVGADNNGSISRKTDYVIVGKGAGRKKLEQIEALGIETILEDRFIELFNL